MREIPGHGLERLDQICFGRLAVLHRIQIRFEELQQVWDKICLYGLRYQGWTIFLIELFQEVASRRQSGTRTAFHGRMEAFDAFKRRKAPDTGLNKF